MACDCENQKPIEVTESDYNQLFGIKHYENNQKSHDMPNNDYEKNKLALDYALDIRKFEIGLYWQRTAYFWAFIALAFTAYFAVITSTDMTDKQLQNLALLIISCLGVIFSLGWVLANKGSKKWQENWENHVDRLEDNIIGPLYKTVLSRPTNVAKSNTQHIEDFLIGPAPYSVSKINGVIGIATCAIWILLFIYSIPIEPIIKHHNAVMSIAVGVVCIVGVFGLIGFLGLFNQYGFTRTHTGNHCHSIAKRKFCTEEDHKPEKPKKAKHSKKSKRD